MKKAIFASAALLAFAAAVPANAAVLFSDNFDSEGTPAADNLQYNGFTQWTVTGGVDLVYTPNGYGITCSGKCVDLDGTSGPGAITTAAPIAFAAGGLVTISFDLSGSQRSAAADNFDVLVSFGSPQDILGFAATGFVPNFVPGDYTGITGFDTFGTQSVAGTDPFKTYSFVFTPTTAGSFTLKFSTTSGDNVGPVLDNVLVTQNSVRTPGGAVPEPATWAMMIGGFALAGAAMRRRKAAVSFA